VSARILIADDEHGYRSALVDMFIDAGFDVVEAESEEAAVSCAPDADVWIIDVRLPTGEREGLRAVSRLIDDGLWPKFPIVFISVDSEAEADAKGQVTALKARNVPYEWCQKPFEPEYLLQKVESYLGGEGR
jgi:CheY-like chemotaxis protein